MARLAIAIGALALLAVGGTFVAVQDRGAGEREAVSAAAQGKSADRLGGEAAGREPIRHALPGYKWFGERDESRLPGRHLGSYVEVIETDEGVVLILDDGSNVVYEHDPETASTTIAENYPIPTVTPRQAVDSPDGEIDLKVYTPEMTVAGEVPDGAAATKGDRLPETRVR